MELKVNQDNCLGCGICVIACPVNAAISPENAGGNGAKTEEVVMMVENGFIKSLAEEYNLATAYITDYSSQK